MFADVDNLFWGFCFLLRFLLKYLHGFAVNISGGTFKNRPLKNRSASPHRISTALPNPQVSDSFEICGAKGLHYQSISQLTSFLNEELSPLPVANHKLKVYGEGGGG
ncbi:hypothetical protein CDAR_9871 [Caerostris darwini]|uniref:Uncharacterized protein n=1 Tax=Caerostris darwini TaxID=1538125 RepID=A0AAV4S095_9ARAC|nr:hypothetical protein CDAR_9871 [Caerostris darwini]